MQVLISWRQGSRTAAGKTNEFGFHTQTTGPGKVEKAARALVGSRMPPGKANEFGFCARTLGREKGEIEPGRRHGSRTAPGKANEFGFCARTLGREKTGPWPGRRHGSRTPPGGCRHRFVFIKYNLTKSTAFYEKKFKSMSYEILPSEQYVPY